MEVMATGKAMRYVFLKLKIDLAFCYLRTILSSLFFVTSMIKHLQPVSFLSPFPMRSAKAKATTASQKAVANYFE